MSGQALNGGETPLVAIDIGGTHARFALASVSAQGSVTLGEPVTLHTRDHASFQTAWEAFAAQQGGDRGISDVDDRYAGHGAQLPGL